MKKILIAFASVILVSVAALFVFLLFAARDIAEPDTDDLAVERPEIPAEDNAYTYFESATDDLHWPNDSSVVTDYIDGETVDMEALKKVIAKNRDMLKHFNHGIECRRCITPEVSDFDALLPYLSPWRNMGRLLAAKTRYERLSGHYADATDTCMSLLKFADLIQQDAECTINYLVGVAILDIGLTQARDLVRDPGMPGSELKKLSESLADLGPFAPGLIRTIKGEYKITANAIDDLAAGNLTIEDITGTSPPIFEGIWINSYMFQPNRTKLIFANGYRNLITNAPLASADMNLPDFKEFFRLKESKGTVMLKPNAAGKILYVVLMPVLDGALKRKCKTECRVAATHLLAVIHLYKKNNGAFPENLQELVPEYLDAVPVDPYDGQEFRYKAQERIIYSVGKDGKDSGGSSEPLSESEFDSGQSSRWDSEDIVFRIEKNTEKTETNVPSEADQNASSVLTLWTPLSQSNAFRLRREMIK